MSKIFRNNSGFSMVEMMVTVAIFVILAGGLFTILQVGDSSWQINKAKVDLQQELRKAIDWMKNELREAGPSSIVDVPADGSWYTAITFKTPSGVSGGSIVWNANTINFALSSGQLQRTSASVVKVLAQDISLLRFRRQAATSDILEIELQGSKNTTKGDTVTFALDYKVQLRN